MMKMKKKEGGDKKKTPHGEEYQTKVASQQTLIMFGLSLREARERECTRSIKNHAYVDGWSTGKGLTPGGVGEKIMNETLRPHLQLFIYERQYPPLYASPDRNYAPPLAGRSCSQPHSQHPHRRLLNLHQHHVLHPHDELYIYVCTLPNPSTTLYFAWKNVNAFI